MLFPVANFGGRMTAVTAALEAAISGTAIIDVQKWHIAAFTLNNAAFTNRSVKLSSSVSDFLGNPRTFHGNC
jgi:hypothetical protein